MRFQHNSKFTFLIDVGEQAEFECAPHVLFTSQVIPAWMANTNEKQSQERSAAISLSTEVDSFLAA
jgi:hypothetical protein